VPQDNSVLVLSYEGSHLLRLGPPMTVETDPKDAVYDPEAGICRNRGKSWDIIGLYPGRPILTGHDVEELILDAETQRVSVVKGGHTIWSSPFENSSGDWSAVTFSPDRRFIVLGCPYDFDFRVWMRGADTKPKGALTRPTKVAGEPS
jgi:hypothetical protein